MTARAGRWRTGASEPVVPPEPRRGRRERHDLHVGGRQRPAGRRCGWRARRRDVERVRAAPPTGPSHRPRRIARRTPLRARVGSPDDVAARTVARAGSERGCWRWRVGAERVRRRRAALARRAAAETERQSAAAARRPRRTLTAWSRRCGRRCRRRGAWPVRAIRCTSVTAGAVRRAAPGSPSRTAYISPPAWTIDTRSSLPPSNVATTLRTGVEPSARPPSSRRASCSAGWRGRRWSPPSRSDRPARSASSVSVASLPVPVFFFSKVRLVSPRITTSRDRLNMRNAKTSFAR